MKKNIYTLILIAGLIFELRAQVVLYEDFTAPFNPAAAGWDVQNLSSPTGTNVTGWYQGTQVKFDALSGGPNDYFAADMYATSSAGATNTISCWLITPTLNLVNGAWFQFATTNSKLPAAKADRFQVYYSNGAGNNVGATVGSATNTAGTFTNILLDYNAALNANGYSNLWGVVTVSLTGITNPGVGRLAFRYYVPNGGASGPNANYIGIDEFRYSLPCPRPVFFGDPATNGPICVGQPTKFMIFQTNPNNPVTSYTWSNGATTSTTNLIPTSTGVKAHWTLGETTPGCQGLDVSLFLVLPSPTISVVQNPATNVCSGNSMTVTASGGTTYTYLVGSAASTVNPIVLTAPTVTNGILSQFSVSGTGTNGCTAIKQITVHIDPAPVVSVSVSKNPVCTKGTVTLTASGASSYSWSGAATSATAAVNYSAGTVAGVQQFTLFGVSPQGCRSANIVTSLTVSACTGLNGQDQNSGISVYPNPFSDQLNIQGFPGLFGIYNTLGELVLEADNRDSPVIETSSLPAGIYFLKLQHDQAAGIKIIKQ